jgi:hypothetical protein
MTLAHPKRRAITPFRVSMDRPPSNDLRLPELDEHPEDDPDVEAFVGDVLHVLQRDDA